MKALLHFLLLIFFLFPSFLFAEELPELKIICMAKTAMLFDLESELLKSISNYNHLEKQLAEDRDKMDETRKLLMNAELGEISEDGWKLLREDNSKLLSDDQLIEIFKEEITDKLDTYVKLVEFYKKDLQEKKEETESLLKEIEEARSVLAKIGCEIPSPLKLGLPGEKIETTESDKKIAPPVKPSYPYELFLGNWKGTAKVTKSNEPKYVGLSSPYTLAISGKDNELELVDPTGMLGKPNAYKIKSNGNNLQVSYSGPANLEVPQVTTTLTFTINLAINGNKLTGNISSTTKSVYEGPAGSGAADSFVEMTLSLERIP